MFTLRASSVANGLQTMTHDAVLGRLKMREWKMRYGQNCKGGKCRSKPYGTPTRDYIETALKIIGKEFPDLL